MAKVPRKKNSQKDRLSSTRLQATAPIMNIPSSPPLLLSSLFQSQLSPQLPRMQYPPVSQSITVPHTPVPYRYRTSSIFEPLEGVDAILSKVGRLTEAVEESSDGEDFQNTPLNDFVEAETTQEFLNEDILSDEDSDQLSDWEDLNQNTSALEAMRESV